MINLCDHDVSKQFQYTGTIAGIKSKPVLIYRVFQKELYNFESL